MRGRWRSQHRDGRRKRRRVRQGALLLEAMLALAIFVMAGSAVLGLIGGSREALERMRLDERAADLARSAMAKLESGMESAQTLNGPVKPWSADPGGEIVFQVGGEETRQGPGWELRVETEKTQFTGLTKVTITALKRRSLSGDAVAASYTLRQLVRLSGKGADEVGGDDDLAEAAKRGLNEPGSPSSMSGANGARSAGSGGGRP